MALRGLAISMEYFQSLLEVSPNLYHLEVNYEFLQPLFDNEYTCLLFGHRITHLYMTVPLLMSLESVTFSISRLPSIFPCLKHFYFNLEKGYQSSESLILAVLKYLSQWNFLVSFGVVDIVMTKEILSKDIQQWVLENSTLHKRKSFFVDYVDNIFRLWL
jgi:hypothetical protein